MFRTLLLALCLVLPGPVLAQQWQDVPTSPRITLPDHGVEVSVAAVNYGLLGIDYLQIRERTIGSVHWQAVYGHQHGSDSMTDAVKQAGGYVQYINSVLPAYNQYLATRYPPLGVGPVFGTGILDQLNKALYESFRMLAAANGQPSIGPK